ncbi:alkaline ceramidase [Ceratobasidium sp. AG-Ba]|nr:alkaline ceramidase [Ceratobasidium sp. AG-Ba]
MMQPAPVHRTGQLTHGFWGNHTSTIDWCEGNYVHSRFIAETYNTLSNIPFVVLAIVGAISVLRPSRLSKPLPHARRFALMHALLALVGAGSFVFHATLKWRAQVMFDEMPMLLVTCAALYSIRVPIRPESLGTLVLPRKPGGSSTAEPKDQHFWLRLRWQIGTPLFALCTCIIYLRLPHPLIHQFTFAILMCCNAGIVFGLLTHPNLRVPLSPLPKSSKAESTQPTDSETAGAVAFRTLASGLAIFLSGFAIWIADNLFCDSLSYIRDAAVGRDGGMVGILTQGHAWWHLLTGLGANWLIVGLTYLRLAVTDPLAFEVAHYWGIVPGRVVYIYDGNMDDLYNDYDSSSVSERLDKAFTAESARRITLPLPDDLKMTFPPGVPKYDPSAMPHSRFHEYQLRPNFIPPLRYYALQVLEPYYGCIDPLDELLDPHVVVGQKRVNIVDVLLPHAKCNLEHVHPAIWAILIQIYNSLPERFSKFSLALNDAHLTTLATIPNTPNFSVVTFLDLSGCNELLDENISFLKVLNSLCVFDASRTRLTDQGVKNFKSTLFLREPGPAYLRSWSLRMCRGVTAKVLGSFLAFPLLCVLVPSQLKTFWPTQTRLSALENTEYFAPNPLCMIPALLQQLESSSFLHSQDDPNAKTPYVIHVDRIRPEPLARSRPRSTTSVSRVGQNAFYVGASYIEPSQREEKPWPNYYKRYDYSAEEDVNDDWYSSGSPDWPVDDMSDQGSLNGSDDSLNENEVSSDDDSASISSSRQSSEGAGHSDSGPSIPQAAAPSFQTTPSSPPFSSPPASSFSNNNQPSDRPTLPDVGSVNSTLRNEFVPHSRNSDSEILPAVTSQPDHSDGESDNSMLQEALERENETTSQAISRFFNTRAQAGLAPPRKYLKSYSSDSSSSYDSEKRRKRRRVEFSDFGDVELALIRKPPPWQTVQRLIDAKSKLGAARELQSQDQQKPGAHASAQPARTRKLATNGALIAWNSILASSSKKSTPPSDGSGLAMAGPSNEVRHSQHPPSATLPRLSQMKDKPVRRTTIGRPPTDPGTFVRKLK